jgi:invasion protein IalB
LNAVRQFAPPIGLAVSQGRTLNSVTKYLAAVTYHRC